MTAPDRHTTPRRPVSIEDDLWEPLGELVGPRRRSEVIRALIAWYIRRPGAPLPQRPPRRDA